MREIVFDTETTGLDPVQGHRLVEIGCVELLNRFPTGRTFHKYINPERDMPIEAFNVQGLAKRPVFARDRIIDTLMLARRKHPGGSNKLDDLCVRYKIDNSKRTKHGALLDAELLAEVYVELIGARQANLGLATVV